MTQNISVVKRSGTIELYDQAKIQRQIQYACSGITNVSESMIELNMHVELYDGITTEHIDQLILNSAANLTIATDGHVNYEFVAGRLQNSILRKRVYGRFDPPPLLQIVTSNVLAGLYTPDLLVWYNASEWNLMDSLLDHNKDELLSLSAIAQFESKYLISNRSTGQIYETPQVRYMIASAVIMHAETINRMSFVADMYRTLSNGEVSTATPIAAGLGTNTKQFSSCVKISVDDTLDSIFASGEMMGKYASKRAGIGFEAGRIRRSGAPIRNGEIAHTGLVPFIKKWFGDLRATSQGGIRSASATFFFPVWHYDYEDLVVLKNNKGTTENRERRLDYAFNTNKYLWRRFKNNQPITLFCPHSAIGLYDAYYSDQDKFVELYERYENDPTIDKKVVSADSVFGTLIRERSETNRIYLGFVDNWSNGPIDVKKHPIVQSNLCLTGDTLIHTSSGKKTLKELYDLQETFYVWSDERSYENNYVLEQREGLGCKLEKSSKVFMTNDNATVYKLTLDNGYSITGTYDHKVMTELGMVPIGEITQEDCVYILGSSSYVNSVYPYGQAPVYDITVENSHSFIANGIVVHNCMEIIGPTIPFQRIEDDKGEIFLCTLASNNWGKFKKPTDMKKSVQLTVRMLNNILDYQDFLSVQSNNSNENFRPLGIGVTNLAYWHAKRGLKYGTPESLALVKMWMEHQYFYALSASVDLAKERGPCKEWKDTCYAQGKFVWELRADGVNTLTDFTPDSTLDWESLRARMQVYGVRNALLGAIAPVESSSVMIGSTNGIAIPKSLITTKESKGVSKSQVVPEYEKLKGKYQLMFDTDVIDYLKVAAVMQVYICQSISTDTFYDPAKYPAGKVDATEVARNIMLAQHWGIKTLYYNITNKSGSKKQLEEIEPVTEEHCESCIL